MIESILFMVAALVYLVTAWLVIARVPRNAVGWTLAATGVLLAIAAWTEYEFIENLWLPAPVAIALPLVFPDGRPFWRWVAWTGAAGLVCGTLGVLDDITTLLLSVAAIGAGVSVLVRLRRSRGVERQQLKWFAYVAGLFVIALIFATAAELGGIFDVIGPLAGLIMLLLIGFGIPIATGFAVLRYRLYEIDVVIKRTLVYTGLTATLAATYLASVLLLQLLLSPSSDVAVAASTLAVAALFRPARIRIQAFVDQRFYRSSYDAMETVEAFGARLRHEVSLEALSDELRVVVTDAMHPAHVSVWLKDGRR